MENILTIKGLHKHYGKVRAVDNLSLEIEKGQIFGILGPNGSGKSTTLGIALDVVAKKEGEVRWFGQPPSKHSRKRIGAILESPSFYHYLSAYDNLKVVAKIKGAKVENIDKVLETVGLSSRKNDPFKTYSLGMKQRLSIGSALLSDPEVLILDEPTNGLDPQGIAEIRTLIRDIGKQGKTIILASHLLDEVQRVCTHFAVLKSGKKMYNGSVAEALKDIPKVAVKAADQALLKSTLLSSQKFDKLEENEESLLVTLEQESDIESLHKYLIEKGIVLTHLAQQTKSLEKQFLEILGANSDSVN
ncbi:ABC transporter ATP-binding protein [Flammeovirgaceae bacterium SG7u.111]|nr:ABC transporter ATP-binding protein [Flammeovirgaceae bacterium SG7u.132]WPO38180.1 ABC transporter ATP-binding protein [Flammeovirgaceae bacterium SG7u.111]